MTRRPPPPPPPPPLAAIALLFMLAACGRRQEPANGAALLADLPGAAPGMAAPPAADTPQDTSDPLRFQPLRSAAVKDAIHRALRTGTTQRWADGALTGYAVPSAATDANGCRAVRYTVDQRSGAAPEAITACDANAR